MAKNINNAKVGEVIDTGSVATRINIANLSTKTTPLKKTKTPYKAGFQHVVKGHFGQYPTQNNSIFTISETELKTILKDKKTIFSPVVKQSNETFVRIVDVGKNIGITSLKDGGGPTNFIIIYTDKSGNLLTTFPIKGLNNAAQN